MTGFSSPDIVDSEAVVLSSRSGTYLGSELPKRKLSPGVSEAEELELYSLVRKVISDQGLCGQPAVYTTVCSGWYSAYRRAGI